jgi:hypothetical protein
MKSLNNSRQRRRVRNRIIKGNVKRRKFKTEHNEQRHESERCETYVKK